MRGALLERLYLETRRGLVLANQGGARAEVKRVELATEPGEDGGFVATATWSVAGSVAHRGHVHERRNPYRAELLVTPADGVWKLVDLEILEEQRLLAGRGPRVALTSGPSGSPPPRDGAPVGGTCPRDGRPG